MAEEVDYENVPGSYNLPRRSRITYVKMIFNGVLVLALIGLVIFLLKKPIYSNSNPGIVINVSDITLLDQMEERYQVKERIRHQLINAVNKSSNMLFEMSRNMQQVSSLLMKMVHVPHTETSGAEESTIDVGNATDFKQCFVRGFCMEGHFLNVSKADNYSSCLERCELEEFCQWISFDLELNFCSLFKECPNIVVRLPSEIPEYSFQKKNGTYFKHITSKINCPKEIPCNATGRCEVCIFE